LDPQGSSVRFRDVYLIVSSSPRLPWRTVSCRRGGSQPSASPRHQRPVRRPALGSPGPLEAPG
jgi:hypothetical protein